MTLDLDKIEARIGAGIESICYSAIRVDLKHSSNPMKA